MNTRSWSIRSKIISLVAVPIAALTALWIFATTLTLGPALSLLSAQGLLDDVGRPGENVVAELQQERRLSLVYLAGRTSPERLAAARVETDNAIAEFRRRSADADTSDALAERLGQLDQAFAVLPSGRDFIDRRDMDKAGALGLYNGVIDSAFRAFAVLVALPDEQLARDARAITSLGRAREVLARADALLAGVFAGGRFAADEHSQLVQIVGTERYLYESAVADLPDADRAAYTQLTEGAAATQLNDMLNTLVSKGRTNAPPPIAATAWQSAYDTVQHNLREFELAASDRLADRSIPVATGILVRLGLAGILGLIAVGVALYISIGVGRGLIRRLDGLRAAALELADERLPALIGRLRRGQEVDVAAESPPLEFGNDELGQVGQAFAAVQRTAVASAVDEATLRRGLSDVFLNIARRSQTLLHRQLALLDKMERRTTDPDELGDLFRVDHLATRMRRHAEDLVVLAGAAPGRGWRTPVPMIDVIRGAVSEVEDYPRVNIMAIEPAAVAGRAVADVIHLLAELIENATSFSPPHTKVHVAGQSVPNGYAIEIEDRGLGMSPEAIDEANQRLSEPPEFDPANSARLGLFVVAQLGARHGVRVRLRPSPYGGVTAVALLPTALIGAGTGALALPGRAPAEVEAPADLALPAGEAQAVLVPADETPMWTVPASSENTSTGAWASSPGANWPTALSGGLTTPPPSPADALAEPTPVLGLPVQRRRRPPEEATAELVIGDDGLPRRNRQRHLAPQLRRPVDEPSGGFATRPSSAPPAPLDPDEVRARMSALQAGTNRGRRESANLTPAPPAADGGSKPMWTPPPPAGDDTRALRITRYTSPTTSAPADGASTDGNGANGSTGPHDGGAATEDDASGQLPDSTEGTGSTTPPVPSDQPPAPAAEGASQVKDPSGKDA
ncbi:nitrate- and nitrite sensing domain-containing protein [Asanoa sp. WMMD1127]|uniref:nitrate- and nitrite sensing domain-containing protein n=1 Tax=Asanoa sp. WMMD1127 TaxID=3016107 RepID=UPI0024175568|nr:nitrate- and nitrite sensing domain-containing protein [Asanoa sp. WMMD1127]MDG4820429.1 nitrate- and nitrite sensing domain-containing protein [Asanoa sp. WMMD1127]